MPGRIERYEEHRCIRYAGCGHPEALHTRRAYYGPP